MSATHRPGRLGIVLALTSAVLFGASTPLAKALLGDVSPWMLAGQLYLGSGVGLFCVSRIRNWRGGETAEAPLRAADLPWLGAVILSGGVAGPLLLMLGLTSTPASAASLLLNLEAIFTLAIAWTVFRENVDLRVGIGAAAILTGALLVSWSGGVSGVGWGAAAIGGACLAWAIDNNLTRKLSAADPLQIAMIKGLVAGAVNVGLATVLQQHWPAAPAIAAAGVVGFLGYGVSLTCFVLALRHLGAARTGAYFSLAPFVGALIAIVGFGDPLTPLFLAASALMAVGLYLHLVEQHAHDHVHEPLRHEHRHIHDTHHQHSHGPNDPVGEPHTHVHVHARIMHRHPHYPDIHHRHAHEA